MVGDGCFCNEDYIYFFGYRCDAGVDDLLVVQTLKILVIDLLLALFDRFDERWVSHAFARTVGTITDNKMC